MWNQSILGFDLYHVMYLFFVYSILGWLVESIYMSICNRKLTNRGFLWSPFCPIYGTGALTVYFILRPFEGNFILLYLMGSVLATTLEFLTARVMLNLFGEVWWDYNEKPFNYKGILCLESSIAWGFYTVFLFMFLHRFAIRLIHLIPYRQGRYFLAVGTFLLMVDFAVHLLRQKTDNVPKNLHELKESIHHALPKWGAK